MGACASSIAPSGWVDVSWYYTSSCGTGSFTPNAHTIKQLAGYPVGTTTLACGSSIAPPGWVDVSWYYTSSCGTGSFTPNARTIKRIY
ncbi:hypothetical protein [Micromonospora fulviviridis]|uniref:Ig-like domain-containing protein n=1 Tax=Micromonospora fulviviridis TaxID=47860 RepID=A0ABV2VUX9_9ACTN